MIDLYYAPTPNGWKISIMLEECETDYKVIPVNLGKGDQFTPEFLKISPNNNEYDRLLGVMDRVLNEREYLAGDYSIADMASFPWITAYKRYEVDLDSFKNVRRWFDAIKSRPAVRRGIDVGKAARNFGEGISKESLKTMFKQDAKSISDMAKKKEKE